MVSITTEITPELLEELIQLSKENHRHLPQEISYRLEQAIRYRTHLSREDIGLIEALSQHISRTDSDDESTLLECITREDGIKH